MKVKKAHVSALTIEMRTSQNKERSSSMIERVNRFNANKAGVNGECKCCSYLFPDRIGGAAITETECGICNKPMVFSSTCVDALCKHCAAENLLCKRCGADIDMKYRRKPRLFQQRHGAEGE